MSPTAPTRLLCWSFWPFVLCWPAAYMFQDRSSCLGLMRGPPRKWLGPSRTRIDEHNLKTDQEVYAVVSNARGVHGRPASASSTRGPVADRNAGHKAAPFFSGDAAPSLYQSKQIRPPYHPYHRKMSSRSSSSPPLKW